MNTDNKRRKGLSMEKIKAIAIALWGSLMSALGILAIPTMLLVICNLIDYITGICAAKYRSETVNSYKGIRGIAKKIGMWLLVGVGVIVDTLLQYASGVVGITLPFTFFISCVAAVWLVCNELISILENISDIGVTLPPFLQPIITNLKKQVEDKANLKDKGEE